LILIGVTFVGVNKPLSQVVNTFEDQPDGEFKKLKKSFTIIIYDCNDSGQYYKTNIMIGYAPNLALVLASVANYNHN
jgi:hypothetical protein